MPVSTFLCRSLPYFLSKIVSTRWTHQPPSVFGRDECVHQLVRNMHLVQTQLGLTLPTNSTLFCRQWTDGSTCPQAMPRDLHDALIIQIFDSHEVTLLRILIQSHVPWVMSVWPCFTWYLWSWQHLEHCVRLCFCSSAKPSTALWTRARLHRLVCPPTTTLCWVSTTPGMTSHCERLVHLTHTNTHAVYLLLYHVQRGLHTSSSCYTDTQLA